jgi:hypothetical protein
METLIYKRTHNGDPDPASGVFGCNHWMGQVLGYLYDAVIGIGGISAWPRREGIAGRLTGISIGPHKSGGLKNPQVRLITFGTMDPLKSLFGRLRRAVFALLSAKGALDHE